MWKTLLSLLILFFVISCSNPERMAEMVEKTERSEIADSTVVLDMDVCSVDELPLSMLIKDVKYVELETNDSSYLYAPANIKITDSLIYVSDVREQLKRFDLEGNFIDDVYTRGQGPGEVVRLYDFDVDNDSLYLLDGAKSSILVYDHRRTLGSMRQLPFRATRFKHLSDGRFLFALAPYGLGNEEQSSLIALTDAHFTIQNTFFSQNVQVEGSTVRSPYFENSSSSIYFSPIYKRSIYRLDGKNLWMNYYLDFHTPYYETSKNVDGMVEAQEKGLYYTYTNPFHDDLYLWQSFFTSADKRGLLLIRLSDNKAVFIKNIRNDMYARFLSTRILIKTLTVVAFLIILYLLTHSAFFLYSTPIFMIVALILAIGTAEYIVTKTRKEIVIQLKHYKKAREQLLQYEKIKF